MIQLEGESRDKPLDGTSVAVASEKEEVPDESAFSIVAFSDGVRYRRFSGTCGTTEPAYRWAAAISPFHKFCNNAISSARVAFGDGSFPVICSAADGRK